MTLSRYEQETILTYNEEESTAGVYTHNKALIRKLEKLAQERPEECRLEKASHDGQAVDYIIPKAWIRIRPTRILSEAEKEQLREASKGTRFARMGGGIRREKDHKPIAEGSYIPQAPERRKGGGDRG